MSNGPYARVAESVVIDIPRPRMRASIIHDPGYYLILNHLVDFLTSRPKLLSEQQEDPAESLNRRPETVRLAFAQVPDHAVQTSLKKAPEDASSLSTNPTLTVLTGTRS